jgi:hypothetical protein
MRWNGTAWTTAPGPSPTGSYLSSAAVAPDGTAWAVGCANCGTRTSTGARLLILRWNGTAWTRVPSPVPGPGTDLSRVIALSSSDAWAVGIADGIAGEYGLPLYQYNQI